MNDPDAQPDTPKTPGALLHAGLRLAGIFALLLVFTGALYVLPGLTSNKVGPGYAVGVSILFVVPFCVGALASLLLDPKGTRDLGFHIGALPFTMIIALIMIGGLALREGIICMLMLFPVWWLFAALGGFTVYRLHRGFHDRQRTRVFSSLFASLAALSTLIDPTAFIGEQAFTTSREVIIDAPAETVWPHLLSIENIGVDESTWNLTQGLIGVPRPASARLVGNGEGAVRYAEWGANIGFEEHITQWTANRNLAWSFVFPDDSIATHTDRHIHPAGAHLTVASGGYRLTPLPGNRTELTLYTDYRLNTPLNHYAALWGNFMLGDIQDNILHIVKDRSEAAAAQP